MSGFNYYLECANCKAVSQPYPYLFGQGSGQVLYLPAVCSDDFTGVEIDIPIDERQAFVSDRTGDFQFRFLLRIAQQLTNETISVSVPLLSMEGAIRLDPPLPCPKCGSHLGAKWGLAQPKILLC